MSLGILVFATNVCGLRAQETAPVPREQPAAPSLPPAAIPEAMDRALPINLETVLRLANARPLDIALAGQRVRAAAAELERARVLWVPTLLLGGDYFRHDGQIQAVDGTIFGTSKGAVFLGAGPYAVFSTTDAIFTPLAARQVVKAREAGEQAARNDSLYSVAEAFFAVQRSRGELAGASDLAGRAETLARRAEQLAPGLVPPVEAIRARAELRERRQEVVRSRERWRVASAELARLLRLEASTLVEPIEPPHLRVNLLDGNRTVADLLPIALRNRPELAAQQALVEVTLARLRQEKMRPLLPSVLLRGAGTNPAGTLAGGVFGGGFNSSIASYSARSDWDVQVLWELQNLGLGNRARIHEGQANHEAAKVELYRAQYQVAADVASAHARLRSAADRFAEAQSGLEDAITSFNLNLEGLGQTKRAGNLLVMVIRPLEVVAAVQALSRAYSNYYGVIAEYNQAQFLLYRALGQPAQSLLTPEPSSAPDANTTPPGLATPLNSPAAAPQTFRPTLWRSSSASLPNAPATAVPSH